MLMPPDAEPVMPASTVTVIASLTSGLGIEPSASATTRKPGRAAITAPKPYSEAVFIDASHAPPSAFSVSSAKLARNGFNAKTLTDEGKKVEVGTNVSDREELGGRSE